MSIVTAERAPYAVLDPGFVLPRRPTRTPLYLLVQRHLETSASVGRGFPYPLAGTMRTMPDLATRPDYYNMEWIPRPVRS